MPSRPYAKRSTVVWKLNRFRQYLLLEILEDLQRLEANPLSEEQCMHVQRCLEDVVRECSKRTDQIIDRVLTQHLDKFRQSYIKWNGPRGHDADAIRQRRDHLRELRLTRKRMSEDIGPSQLALDELINDSFCDELWRRLESIPTVYPAEFVYSARAFRKVRTALAKPPAPPHPPWLS